MDIRRNGKKYSQNSSEEIQIHNKSKIVNTVTKLHKHNVISSFRANKIAHKILNLIHLGMTLESIKPEKLMVPDYLQL